MNRDRIKIGFLDVSETFSGAENSLKSLIQPLDRSRFEPVLYFPCPMPHHERYMDANVEFRYLADDLKWWMGSKRWKRPVRGADALRRAILAMRLSRCVGRDQISILHINLVCRETWLWLPFLRRRGARIVGHCRSLPWTWIPSERIQRYFDRLICVSDCILERLRTKCAEAPGVRVYDPVETPEAWLSIGRNEARRSLGFDEGRQIVSSVGLLSSHKGHDTAIEVFSHLASDYPNLDLLVAGGGSEKELSRLRELASVCGIGDRVRFTGKQVDTIEIVYRASEFVYSLTKGGEAFGRVPVEAAAAERAVIAPNIGAAVEIVTDGVTGRLVDPENCEQIVRVSRSLLDDPQRTKQIGSAGRAHVVKCLSPGVHASEVEEVYESVLGESRR